ncbi:alkaline phosphatase family protein [Sodalis sp. RH16]|uniref:alkaline phosphatase family protein n=1 Tax=Sodalis sp. RH16 TaxID=3394331 RepID=UPI0039B69B82
MSKKVIVFGVDGLMMPLIQKFAAEGALPHIRTMLEQGAAAELLPFISAWGDVNWVSFLSGQSPGTAWVGQAIPADNARNANLLYQLERNGLRAALVHFPESIAAPAPHFTFSPYWGRAEPCPWELYPPAVFTTRYEARRQARTERSQTLGWPPSSPLAYHDKGLWRPLNPTDEKNLYRLDYPATGKTFLLDCRHATPLIRDGERGTELVPGRWSPWLALGPDEDYGQVRFYPGRYDPEHNDIEIIQSQVTLPGRMASDAQLGKALVGQLGPFISQWAVKAAVQETYIRSTYRDAEDQSLWLADSALYLTHQQGYALWIAVHHLIDESHHLCLGQYDPRSPFYDAAQAPRYEAVMRECYQILDRSIGKIIAAMDDDCTLLLASDHGAVPNEYMCDIHRYLARRGLVTLDAQGRPLAARSQVYLKDERGGLEIFINLAGREAGGIVPAARYEAVTEQVLKALGEWQVMHDGQPRKAVAWALRKADAASVGYWGDHAGDVLFTYNTGFVWGTSRHGEDICPVNAPGANHGPQKPTAETEHSANYGVILAYGAGIRKGYYRDRLQRGPHRMTDPAATIAHLLGMEHDALDGNVMYDFLTRDAAQ